jgi:hypothetical protein
LFGPEATRPAPPRPGGSAPDDEGDDHRPMGAVSLPHPPAPDTAEHEHEHEHEGDEG